jgi:hypothetical protein
MKNFISDHKSYITITFIIMAVIGLGTYKTIHFLNTGYTVPLTQTASKSSKSTNQSARGPLISTPLVSKPNSPITPPPISSFDNSSGTASPAPASYTFTPTTNNRPTPQGNQQACQQEQTAQNNALVPIQQQIAQVYTEETNLPQTVTQQLSGGLANQNAWNELYNQDLAQLDSQLQSLQNQQNSIRLQYPTPDCS